MGNHKDLLDEKTGNAGEDVIAAIRGGGQNGLGYRETRFHGHTPTGRAGKKYSAFSFSPTSQHLVRVQAHKIVKVDCPAFLATSRMVRLQTSGLFRARKADKSAFSPRVIPSQNSQNGIGGADVPPNVFAFVC